MASFSCIMVLIRYEHFSRTLVFIVGIVECYGVTFPFVTGASRSDSRLVMQMDSTHFPASPIALNMVDRVFQFSELLLRKMMDQLKARSRHCRF